MTISPLRFYDRLLVLFRWQQTCRWRCHIGLLERLQMQRLYARRYHDELSWQLHTRQTAHRRRRPRTSQAWMVVCARFERETARRWPLATAEMRRRALNVKARVRAELALIVFQHGRMRAGRAA